MEPKSQSEKRKAELIRRSDSWFGALEASHYRTFGFLKWLGITTFLCAVLLFVWFVLQQTEEWASMAENRHRVADHSLSLSPTPSPQVGSDALESKRATSFTRFGLWQTPNVSHTPAVQAPQAPFLDAPPEPAEAVTSSPPHDGAAEARAGGLSSEPRPRRLPSVAHRVSHDHHPQFPGTQVKEARRIADLENQRDSLRSQLKETEAKVLAIQKDADLVTNQRDALQARLKESEEKRLAAQQNADLLTGQLADLRVQLRDVESRALAAEKSEELVKTERDALQIRLQETEREAEAAQKNADLAAQQRDALQREIGEVTARAQRAEMNGILADNQREAMQVELKEKQEEEAPEKKAPATQPGSDLAELPMSAPDTQFQKVRPQNRPPRQDAELAQTLPPNPSQNAKPPPLTQTLDSSVQPTGPSTN
jgi:hypothetical protein